MRFIQFLPPVVICLAIPLGYFSSWCGVYSSCPFWSYFYDYAFTVFKPLWVFSLFSVPAVILIPIVKERVFKTWARFAFVWVLLSFLVIAWASEPSSSWFQIIRFGGEDAARIMGILFSGLSLFLLAWQTYMPKKVREAKL